MLNDSIIFMKSDDPSYEGQRKALSAAFFKTKLIGMTKIIKEVSLKEIKAI